MASKPMEGSPEASQPRGSVSVTIQPVLFHELKNHPSGHEFRYPTSPPQDHAPFILEEWIGRTRVLAEYFTIQADLYRKARAEATAWLVRPPRWSARNTAGQALAWDILSQQVSDELERTLDCSLQYVNSEQQGTLYLDDAANHRLDQIRGLQAGILLWDEFADRLGTAATSLLARGTVCKSLEAAIAQGVDADSAEDKQALLKSTTRFFHHDSFCEILYEPQPPGSPLSRKVYPTFFCQKVAGWRSEQYYGPLAEGLNFPRQIRRDLATDEAVGRSVFSELLARATTEGTAVMSDLVWPIFASYLEEAAEHATRVSAPPYSDMPAEQRPLFAEQLRIALEVTIQGYGDAILRSVQVWKELFTNRKSKLKKKNRKWTAEQRAIAYRMQYRTILNEFSASDLVRDRIRHMRQTVPGLGAPEFGRVEYEVDVVSKVSMVSTERAVWEKRLEQNLREQVGVRCLDPVYTFEVLQKEVRGKTSDNDEVLIGRSNAGPGVSEEHEAHPEENTVRDKNRKGVLLLEAKGSLMSLVTIDVVSVDGDETHLEETNDFGPVKSGTGDRPGELDETTELHAADPATDQDFNGNQNSASHVANLRRFYPRYKTDAFDWKASNIRVGTEYEQALRGMSFGDINACKDYGSEDIPATHAAGEDTTTPLMQ